MAAAQVFAAQPDMSVAGLPLWGSAQPASAGYPSSASLFVPATFSAPSAAELTGSSMGSIAAASAPAAAPAQAPAPRPARRRGCMHCITCSGLRHHCHSATVRSSESPAAEWWPGGIHSPGIYYHLRARQLRYAAKHPERAGAAWRPAAQVRGQPSALLTRRGQGPLPLQVPAVYTNVSQTDGGVQYLGERVVPLLAPPAAAAAAAVPAAPLRPAPPAPKRGIEPPQRPARATWAHPYLALSDDEEGSAAATLSHRSSCASTADPKRRCTQPLQPHVITGATPTPTPGHFIVSRGSPVRSQAPSFSSLRGSSSSSMTGVLTPPQGCAAPLSALSDVSLAPMSTGSGGDPWAPLPSGGGAVMSAAWESPVLLLNRAAPVGEGDPTMQQYYARQYNIKQEQAFPCHQIIEIGAGQGGTLAGAAPPPPTEAPSGWTSMLMSLAGSLKRSLSP